MNNRRKHSSAIAGAKAGLSASTAYRCEKDPRLPSQKKTPANGDDPIRSPAFGKGSLAAVESRARIAADRHFRRAVASTSRAFPGNATNPGASLAFEHASEILKDRMDPSSSIWAAMRDAVSDPKKIEPLVPVDLVIDHSVQVDRSGTVDAFLFNLQIEFERNRERYEFLKWGQEAFKSFKEFLQESGLSTKSI